MSCSSPGEPTGGTAVSDEERDRFLETVKSGELGDVQRALARTPTLAAARAPTGRSAVLLALARAPDTRGKGQNFYLAADNPFLKAVLAAHPPLDPFETAAVGDAGALARLLTDDATLLTRVHKSGWTLLHFAAFAAESQRRYRPVETPTSENESSNKQPRNNQPRMDEPRENLWLACDDEPRIGGTNRAARGSNNSAASEMVPVVVQQTATRAPGACERGGSALSESRVARVRGSDVGQRRS
jgi:hypothetical protein